MWIFNAGDERAAKSIDESLRKLQTDYIDLLLIHQPFGDYYGTYRAMQKALAAGKVRAIGLSNFYDARFVDLAENMDVKPAGAVGSQRVYAAKAYARTDGFLWNASDGMGTVGRRPARHLYEFDAHANRRQIR